jgi:hypothetical protein
LGNFAIKRLKRIVFRVSRNQSRHGQSLLDISISLRDV